MRTISFTITLLALCGISQPLLATQGEKLSPWVGKTLHGKPCGGPFIPFGPFDYRQRAAFKAELEVVEENHFTAEIEKLQSGVTGTIIDELHYTLMAWPNHHRALYSALQYRMQHPPNWPDNASAPPAECYLQRAIKFSPNDPKPYMMYGVLLQKRRQYDKALNAYRSANRLAPNDVITQYNMGLTLAELKKYKEAKQLAEKVYAAGFPLPGLKKKLIAAGHWEAEKGPQEPATATPALTAAQVEAIKQAMQAEAARKQASTTQATQ